MRQSSSEQSSCGVSACTLIPQESPPSVIINKEKSRKSTAKVTEPTNKELLILSHARVNFK